MSHFTVIVIGDKIEEQMEPYAEQNFDEKYGTFQDIEEDSLNEYLTKEVDILVLEDGSLHHTYEEKYRKMNRETYQNEYTYPENSIIRKGKFTELYSTFEEYMKDWNGTPSRDEKTNKFGYWHNVNAKWDWYSIGGRWTGYFQPKKGTSGKLGQSGAFDNKPTEGWVDIIKIGDIDVAGMKAYSIKEANETYDKIERILKGRTYPSWQEISKKHEGNIQNARDEYNSNEVVKDFNKENFHIWGDFYEDYGSSREEYLVRQENRTMVPYAVVKEGVWYQKGDMGWWGMSSNEMSQDEWNQKFWEMINSLDSETTLTLLDCHI